MRGTLTIHVDPAATETTVIVESGPFTQACDLDYLYVRPFGYMPVGASSPLPAGDIIHAASVAAARRGAIQLAEVEPPQLTAAQGRVKIVVGPGVRSIELQDCYGQRHGPDGGRHLINGHDRFSLKGSGPPSYKRSATRA